MTRDMVRMLAIVAGLAGKKTDRLTVADCDEVASREAHEIKVGGGVTADDVRRFCAAIRQVVLDRPMS